MTSFTKNLDILDVHTTKVFAEDVESELSEVIRGLKAELKQKGKHAYMATDEGRMAVTYLDLWLKSIESDYKSLDPQMNLGELFLFIASRQADMDMKATGKVQ